MEFRSVHNRYVHMAWLTAALWTTDLLTWPGTHLYYGPWICSYCYSQLCYGPVHMAWLTYSYGAQICSHGLAHSCAMDRRSVHMTWHTFVLWTLDLSHCHAQLCYGPQFCSHGLASILLWTSDVHMAWLTAASWTSNRKAWLTASDLFIWLGSKLCYGPLSVHMAWLTAALQTGPVHMVWLTAALWITDLFTWSG